jgi:hypothetical protein
MTLFSNGIGESHSPGEQPGVRGERGAAVVARAMSLQARIGNLLALALMLAIGVGVLAW